MINFILINVTKLQIIQYRNKYKEATKIIDVWN